LTEFHKTQIEEDKELLEQGNTFGDSHQYYATRGICARGRNEKKLSDLELTLLRLLNEQDSSIKDRVFRSFKRLNLSIRENLRNEMAFRLNIGEETQNISVQIVDGMPIDLENILAKYPPIIWKLILNRPRLLSAQSTLGFILNNLSDINECIDREMSETVSDNILKSKNYIEKLIRVSEREKLINNVINIRKDILGAYFFYTTRIELYWMVIGLIANYIGVTVEALTVVVATHELAHAYSHIGKDIDGDDWETEFFAGTEITIVEGIAQFYTAATAKKLENKYPDMLDAYEKLLELQSGPYRIHEEWLKRKDTKIGEAVRGSMILCRKNKIRHYEQFKNILNENFDRFQVRRSQQTIS